MTKVKLEYKRDWNTPEFKKKTLCTFGIANIFKDGVRDVGKNTPEFGLQFMILMAIIIQRNFRK